ncbi:MAG TPA: response regulator [Rhodospirillaceae bacterium]|nr:response regulator [Rhodospirillaceae bacterium]
MASILVVDDAEYLRAALRRWLELEGHTVIEAEDGDGCLAQLKTTVPDLVILDIFMPGKDGIETIRAIRKLGTGIKIIAITGQPAGGTDYLEFAKALGADRGLRKPFSSEQLFSMIESLIGTAPAVT